MFYKVEQKKSELEILRKESYTRGFDTGLKPLDENLSIKKGYPLFIAGAPHSGKSELIMEILLSLSINLGWKHFIYAGEGGEIEEVIADLCFKLIGKPYRKSDYKHMSESERSYAENFINDHFVFLSDEEDFTIKKFYKIVEQAEIELKIKFDTTLFDPFNDSIDESAKYGGTHHWLNHSLKYVRKISKKNKRVDILVNHIADVPTIIDKETNRAYKRPALPDEWNGGRTWLRRGFLMLLVYRPPTWLKDEKGQPYGENVSLVFVQKAKPKGVAKYGSVSKIYWDFKKNRYYWYDDVGNIVYAFNIEERQATINLTDKLKNNKNYGNENNNNEGFDINFEDHLPF